MTGLDWLAGGILSLALWTLVSLRVRDVQRERLEKRELRRAAARAAGAR